MGEHLDDLRIGRAKLRFEVGAGQSADCLNFVHNIYMANYSEDSIEDLFKEGELVLDTPERALLPVAGRAPTTPLQGAALATAVDGCSEDVMFNGMPGHGLCVSSMNVGSNFGEGQAPLKNSLGGPCMAPLAPPLPTPLVNYLPVDQQWPHCYYTTSSSHAASPGAPERELSKWEGVIWPFQHSRSFYQSN